ncbi:MAG: DUF5125 domain-containing protein [Muribaculaceae bacterium]|nr:DUF5125 domain-containing protein [Muribaculaceae bacterium]
MKKQLLTLAAGMALIAAACSEETGLTKPAIVSLDFPASVCYGDSVDFAVKVADDTALQNVTVSVINGSDILSIAKVTESSGDGIYRGRIAVPAVKDLPDSRLTVMALALDNTSYHTETTCLTDCSHRSYPYITFMADEGGRQFRFDLDGENSYSYSGDLPGQLSGYFVSPEPSAESFASGERRLYWGAEGASASVPASFSLIASDDETVRNVTVSYNTLSYTAQVPVLPSTFRLENDRASVTKTIRKGQPVYFEGLPQDCWIDVDFFEKSGDHWLFRAEDGIYKVTREDEYGYIRVERMNGNEYAGFDENGNQLAIWCIGNAEYGKPDKNNRVDWNTDKGLCMAKTGDHTYELTVKLYYGLSIKFYWQKGWGGEFGGNDYARVDSDWFGVNDSGNFEQSVDGNIVATKYTDDDKYYRITLDVSNGVHAVVLTCTETDL